MSKEIVNISEESYAQTLANNFNQYIDTNYDRNNYTKIKTLLEQTDKYDNLFITGIERRLNDERREFKERGVDLMKLLIKKNNIKEINCKPKNISESNKKGKKDFLIENNDVKSEIIDKIESLEIVKNEIDKYNDVPTKLLSLQQCQKSIQKGERINESLELIPNILAKCSKRTLKQNTCNLLETIIHLNEDDVENLQANIITASLQYNFDNTVDFLLKYLFDENIALIMRLVIVQGFLCVVDNLDVNQVILLFDKLILGYKFKSVGVKNESLSHNLKCLVYKIMERTKFSERICKMGIEFINKKIL